MYFPVCSWASWAGLTWMVLWIQSGLNSLWPVSLTGLSAGCWDGWVDWGLFSHGLSSFSRLVPICFMWQFKRTKSSKRASSNVWALFRSLLASYLLPSYLSKQVVWLNSEFIWKRTTWCHGYRRPLLRQSTIQPYQLFFPSKLFEWSNIALKNQEVLFLHCDISLLLLPQNSVDSVNLAPYAALASFSDVVLPPSHGAAWH